MGVVIKQFIILGHVALDQPIDVNASDLRRKWNRFSDEERRRGYTEV